VHSFFLLSLLYFQKQAHKCPAKNKQQPSNSNSYNLSKEKIAAIKAQLLVLVSRLDRIEQQEMMMEHQKNM
jgi:hypothetical protein